MKLNLTIIVPVFNRPHEILELLGSLVDQTDKHFEVVIVEDGSTSTCEQIVNSFQDQFNIRYYYKENSGPGPSRNYGYEKAEGNYCIFLDSDCILPKSYIQNVRFALTADTFDVYGGPDCALESFTIFQKAVNYSMTSPLTTGGIRGSTNIRQQFFPRSFNMGCPRGALDKTGGFDAMRYGEDVDLGIRMLKAGFRISFLPDAFVYHKRRTNLRSFFWQVFNFGAARVVLTRKHRGSLRVIHLLPAMFVWGTLTTIVLSLTTSSYWLLPLGCFLVILGIHAAVQVRNGLVALVAIATTFTQFFGYGTGMIVTTFRRTPRM